MYLPDYVRTCIDTLEAAGFAAYAVGGCVRDSLLGLTPHDYDLCTDADPAQLQQIFSSYRLVLSGVKHGTVCVMVDGVPVEITTFRLEGGYCDSRHPDWVRFVSSVEEDLSRRDFTINAMAYNPKTGLVDPYGGKEDLTGGILRAVGDPATRFTEDCLRILRGVRFAVRFGLSVELQTESAMRTLAPLMDKLAKERVFEELCKLLPLVKAGDLLRFAPVFVQVIPELAPTVDFDQHSPHHFYDLYTHIAHVVEAAPETPVMRFAALLHDIGKPAAFYRDETGRGHFPDHARIGAQMTEDILLRLKAPTTLRRQVVDLISRHMTPLEPDKRILRRRLGKYGTEETLQLLALQRADFGSKGTGEESDAFDRIADMIAQIQSEEECLCIKNLAVNGTDLMALGFAAGPRIGNCLERLLAMVQDEILPNEKEALLTAAGKILNEY